MNDCIEVNAGIAHTIPYHENSFLFFEIFSANVYFKTAVLSGFIPQKHNNVLEAH